MTTDHNPIASLDPVSLAALALAVSLIRELRIRGQLDDHAEKQVVLGAIGTLRNLLHLRRQPRSKESDEMEEQIDLGRLLGNSEKFRTWMAENKAEDVIDEVLNLLRNYHHLTREPPTG